MLRYLLIAAILIGQAVPAAAQVFNESLLNGLTYRNLGPYRAGAWTVGIAVPETPAKAHRNTIYAILRTGGELGGGPRGGRTRSQSRSAGTRIRSYARSPRLRLATSSRRRTHHCDRNEPAVQLAASTPDPARWAQGS